MNHNNSLYLLSIYFFSRHSFCQLSVLHTTVAVKTDLWLFSLFDWGRESWATCRRWPGCLVQSLEPGCLASSLCQCYRARVGTGQVTLGRYGNVSEKVEMRCRPLPDAVWWREDGGVTGMWRIQRKIFTTYLHSLRRWEDTWIPLTVIKTFLNK